MQFHPRLSGVEPLPTVEVVYDLDVNNTQGRVRYKMLTTRQRWLAGIFGFTSFALGVAAIFWSDNEAGPALLIGTGALFFYVAITGQALKKVSIAGATGEFVEDLAKDPEAPEDLRERAVYALVEDGVELPPQVQGAVEEVQETVVTKAGLLDKISEVAKIKKQNLGVGSSIPKPFFDDLASKYDVPTGTMPEIAGAIVRRAGLNWEPRHWSRGSTVTLAGLKVLLEAVEILERRR